MHHTHIFYIEKSFMTDIVRNDIYINTQLSSYTCQSTAARVAQPLTAAKPIHHIVLPAQETPA